MEVLYLRACIAAVFSLEPPSEKRGGVSEDGCIYPSCYLGSHSCPNESHCDSRIQQLQRTDSNCGNSPEPTADAVKLRKIEEIQR